MFTFFCFKPLFASFAEKFFLKFWRYQNVGVISQQFTHRDSQSEWLSFFQLEYERSQASNSCVRNLSLILVSLFISPVCNSEVFIQPVICY